MEKLSKRDFMAQELFWSLYKTIKVKKLYGESVHKAIEDALQDAYGIVDEILAVTEKN